MVQEWMWTSGTDQGQEGNFLWMSTGKPFIYTRWSAGQPDNMDRSEHCVHVWPVPNNGFGSIYWNDWHCWKELYYICEDRTMMG